MQPIRSEPWLTCGNGDNHEFEEAETKERDHSSYGFGHLSQKALDGGCALESEQDHFSGTHEVHVMNRASSWRFVQVGGMRVTYTVQVTI